MNYSKLEVNLNNIKENIENLKKIQKIDTKVIAMVKANAYGLGAIEISKYLEEKRLADYLGVAQLEEAILIKKFGNHLPIILTTGSSVLELPELVKYEGIYPSVSDLNYALELDKICKIKNIIKKVHIEIDTGMSRYGCNYLEAVDLVKKINKLKNIQIEGIFTHFATGYNNLEYLNLQKSRFDKILDDIEFLNIKIPLIHASNSEASTIIKDNRYNAIRPGLMIYGYYPNEILKENIILKPSLQLISKITNIHEVKKGESIGYSRNYIAKKNIKVAVVNIGYADGYSRAFSNKAKVIINNKICDIIGNICMDSCMIDVTEAEDVKRSNDVYLFDYYNVTVDYLAKLSNTISYEILTNIGNRVKRQYLK